MSASAQTPAASPSPIPSTTMPISTAAIALRRADAHGKAVVSRRRNQPHEQRHAGARRHVNRNENRSSESRVHNGRERSGPQ
jgi:hypothetical protein